MSLKLTLGDKEYFPGINQIQFEGKESRNPLAFKYYDENRIVGEKSMRDHFRFAIAYWHTFCGTGGDPFGLGTKDFPWLRNSSAIECAKEKMDAAFEFITKINVPFCCFHDLDLVSEGKSVIETEKNLRVIVDYAKQKQEASGVKLLWGTAKA